MKVSKSWLQELVDLKVSLKELVSLIPRRTIGIKEATEDFIELDMKGYNRADLLSMRGVAREVAAITGSTLTFHDDPVPKTDLPETKVSVEDEKLCPVYCIAKIEGLKSEPSKEEWVKKLANSGMRTVNNIADVTNLTMLEFGQPMHSFDAEKVTNQALVVRLAKKGETLKTLDDKLRSLDESDLLIADPDKPLGIAGVMGGKDSEASESTNSIFLEAAIFDPVSVRKSAQRHGLYSEAGKRFQHGLTKTNLLQALFSAIKMYEGLGGKLTAITLVGDLEDKSKKVMLTQEKVNSLIGVEIPPPEVEKYLQSLGFHTRSGNVNSWEVTIPYWRLDIELEEDLIEEVARMYGYERIPSKELKGELPKKIDQGLFKLIYNTKKTLADAGLTEVQTYSFYSTTVLQSLGFNESNRNTLVKVANPISSETEYLRSYLWPNLVEVISKNMKQGFEDIAIFEVGKIYQHGEEHPNESYRLAIALMNGSNNPIEELTVILNKVKNIIISFGLRPQDDNDGLGSKLTLEKGGMMKELETLFHPKRYANVKSGDRIIGGLAEVHPRFLNQFGIEKRVAILEISLEN